MRARVPACLLLCLLKASSYIGYARWDKKTFGPFFMNFIESGLFACCISFKDFSNSRKCKENIWVVV
jgi:hypothetical protein